MNRKDKKSFKKVAEKLCVNEKKAVILHAIKNDRGKMPEWSIGAVSKTVVPSGTQGSNPCLSALNRSLRVFSWTPFF